MEYSNIVASDGTLSHFVPVLFDDSDDSGLLPLPSPTSCIFGKSWAFRKFGKKGKMYKILESLEALHF